MARRHGDQARPPGCSLGRGRRARTRGERVDLEAGMAKLFASESACRSRRTRCAPRRLGYYGRVGVERYFRTRLMIVGEGTNEIQRNVIARRLVERAQEG